MPLTGLAALSGIQTGLGQSYYNQQMMQAQNAQYAMNMAGQMSMANQGMTNQAMQHQHSMGSEYWTESGWINKQAEIERKLAIDDLRRTNEGYAQMCVDEIQLIAEQEILQTKLDALREQKKVWETLAIPLKKESE